MQGLEIRNKKILILLKSVESSRTDNKTMHTHAPGVSVNNIEHFCSRYIVYLLSTFHTKYKAKLKRNNTKSRIEDEREFSELSQTH